MMGSHSLHSFTIVLFIVAITSCCAHHPPYSLPAADSGECWWCYHVGGWLLLVWRDTPRSQGCHPFPTFIRAPGIFPEADGHKPKTQSTCSLLHTTYRCFYPELGYFFFVLKYHIKRSWHPLTSSEAYSAADSCWSSQKKQPLDMDEVAGPKLDAQTTNMITFFMNICLLEVTQYG